MTSSDALVDVAGITCRSEPFDWRFSRDEADRIAAHWRRLTAAKPGLFNGRVLMACSLSLDADALHGLSFETSYRDFIAWRDFGWPDRAVYNLFAMPALRSVDGAFMLGRMSATTANAGRLYFPAGTPEPADIGPAGLVDFDANILRELREETGLTAAEVTLASRWTIVFAGPLVACMKVAQSALSADELGSTVARFIATQANPELDELVAIRRPADCDSACTPRFMMRYLEAALNGR